MLTFNLLLNQAGISSKDVYLVRHQDTRVQGQSIYSFYKTNPTQFEVYQKLQGRDCFGKRPYLASFISAPSDRTLFIGLYAIHGHDAFPVALRQCPYSAAPVAPETHYYYMLEPDHRLDELKEKLSIEWGKGYRSWVQNADSKDSGDKKILEFVREAHEEPFPGYRNFYCDVADIPAILPSWQQALKQCKGIYLLVCKDSGKQYVGKADGEGGFFGRFLSYTSTGHSGNEGMKRHSTSGYFVTILEAIATPALGEIDQLEALWKIKLGSRKWGLNEN